MRLIALLLLAALNAAAWNHVGHKAIAGLAYDLMKKSTRAKVDVLIRNHPDYNNWVANAPADPKLRARHAFKAAAFWPDTIRGDNRFYNDDQAGAAATPTLTGFPNMKRHRNWHYTNVPFSTDGTPTSPEATPNVLTEFRRIASVIGKNGSPDTEDDPVYLLPWYLHLGGDIHQPLHCASRWRKGQNDRNGRPMNDLGGNTVFVEGAFNLHAWWDDALGTADTPANVDFLINQLRKQAKEKKEELDPTQWVAQGFALAKEVVYSFGNEGGTSKEHAIKLTPDYENKGRAAARQRAALAAKRLARILDREFK